MKKNLAFSLIISFILIIGLVIVGDRKSWAADSPTSVVKQSYAARAKGDMKALSKLYVDPKEALRMFLMDGEPHDGMKEEAAQTPKTSKFEETIDGDKAIVKIILVYDDSYTPEYHLKKVGGKWKICFNDCSSD